MKRLWFMTLLAATAMACAEGNNPVQLTNAFPLSDTCDLGDKALIRGRLNIAAGGAYVLAFTLFSPLTPEEGSSPAGLYVEEIVLNYETRNPKVTIKEDSEPVYFVVPAGANNDSSVQVNLIGREAREALKAAAPAYPDFMTLLTTVKLKGKLASGKSVETNEVTYPIDITRANGCVSGSPVVPPEAPCAFPGQDAHFSSFTCQ